MADREKARQHYGFQMFLAGGGSESRSEETKNDLIEDLWKRVRDLTGADTAIVPLEENLDLALRGDKELIEGLYIRNLITYETAHEALKRLRSRERHPSGLLDLDSPTHTPKSFLGQIRPGEWASLSVITAVFVGTTVFRRRTMRRYIPRKRYRAVVFAGIVGGMASGAFQQTFKEVQSRILGKNGE